MNTEYQHKIIAEVEIGCALGTKTITEGIQEYNNNGLENARKDIEQYINGTKKRLLYGKPSHMKCAGTNAKAMFKVLFELENKKHLSNFILALEEEMNIRSNSKVLREVENAKIKLSKL